MITTVSLPSPISDLVFHGADKVFVASLNVPIKNNFLKTNVIHLFIL